MHACTPHAHAPATTHAVTVDAVGRLRVVLGPGATVGDLQDVLAKMTDIPASRQNIIRGGTGSVAASLSLSLSLPLSVARALSDTRMQTHTLYIHQVLEEREQLLVDSLGWTSGEEIILRQTSLAT